MDKHALSLLLANAAENNDAKEIERILQTFPSPEDQKQLLDLTLASHNGCSPFLIACKSKSFDAFLFLLEKGVDINLQDNDGNTALHYATEENWDGMLSLLLANPKINITKANNAGNTPLHRAVSVQESKANIKNFLQLGSSAEAMNNEGFSAFHIAIIEGFLEQTEAFVEEDKAIVDQTTVKGESPLWLAIRNDKMEVMKYLFANGADMNVLHGRYGNSVLWLAVDLQNEIAVKFLLESGIKESNIYELGKIDSSPFLISLFGQNQAIRLAVMEKVHNAKIKILFDLLKKEGDLNLIDSKRVDENGNSLLHVAVMTDSIDMVKQIFAVCDSRRLHNYQGKTPEDLASERGVFEIILYLQSTISCESVMFPSLSEVSELSEKYPIFAEEEKDWFFELPNKLNDFEIKSLERQFFVSTSINIDWKTDKFDINNIRSLSEQQHHRKSSGDNPPTGLIKSILKVIHDIEIYLNEKHDIFKHLDVAFFPIGSMVEGTKVGPLNEMDFMSYFRRLNGILTVDSAMSLKMKKAELSSFHQRIQLLFDDNGKLNILKFFVAFVEAIGIAIEHLKDVPENIEIFNEKCNMAECQDKRFLKHLRKQCNHMSGKPPCVCFTKVGAGLNFVCSDSSTEKKTVFTVDLVINFLACLDSDRFSNSTEVRSSIIKYVLSELPVGWKTFLKKYMSNERANLETFVLSNSTESVGVKMIDYTGQFVLRPGLFLQVNQTFRNANIANAYTFLKLLRLLTNSEVKSYDLKKAIFELKDRISEKDSYEIVKLVLKHTSMLGKFSGIMPLLARDFVELDLVDFPKLINGVSHLHFISKKAIHLRELIQCGNFAEVKALYGDDLNEEAFSIHGKYPLHFACENPVLPKLEILEHLLEKGCDVDRLDLNLKSPLMSLISNSSTSMQCFQILASTANVALCNEEGIDAVREAINILDDNEDQACGKQNDQSHKIVI